MEAELVRSFNFEAAHTLPNCPPGHKCSRLHGHSYRLDIHVAGQVDEKTGWVMDFGVIRKLVDPIVGELDHHFLNDLPGLANSTSEQICKFVWDRLRPALPQLSAVTLWESPMSKCVYRGK